MTKSEILEAQLGHYFCTETYHFNHLYRWMKYTDGVRYFANNAGGGAYWLLDILGTELKELAMNESFMAITLAVMPSGKALCTVTDGNETELWRKNLDYTDCPPGDWKFFLNYGVLMLASEY